MHFQAVTREGGEFRGGSRALSREIQPTEHCPRHTESCLLQIEQIKQADLPSWLEGSQGRFGLDKSENFSMKRGNSGITVPGSVQKAVNVTLGDVVSWCCADSWARSQRPFVTLIIL